MTTPFGANQRVWVDEYFLQCDTLGKSVRDVTQMEVSNNGMFETVFRMSPEVCLGHLYLETLSWRWFGTGLGAGFGIWPNFLALVWRAPSTRQHAV